MLSAILRNTAGWIVVSLLLTLIPLNAFGYLKGDINGDDKIGLEESIFSLKVASGISIPLSGKTINVPADIPTIQQAIDAAGNGDTIKIAAGTFTGALIIDGKTLVLKGASSSSTFVEGGTANGVTIDHSPGVLIENLSVRNSVKGILVVNNSNVEIKQVTAKNCTDSGIQIDMNSKAELINVTSDNNVQDGIRIWRNSGVNITGTVSTNNNSRYGLQLFLGSTASIDNSIFASTGNDEIGILAVQNSSLYVEGSTLSLLQNSQYGMVAVDASTVRLNSDSAVTVEESGNAGISLSGSSRLSSDGTITVSNSLLDGFNIADTSSAAFNGDVSIGNCGGRGLSVDRTSTALIAAKLEILNSTGYGVTLSRSSSIQTKDTANVIVKGTSGEGIGIDIGDNSVLRAQGGTFEIKDNIGQGIYVGRNSTLDLRRRGIGLNVTISGNTQGINVYEQGSLRTDSAVLVTGNTGDGIIISGGSTAVLQNITVQNNGGWGINAGDGASLNVSNSTINTNLGGGNINLSFGARSSIFGSGNIGVPLACDSSSISRGDVICP